MGSIRGRTSRGKNGLNVANLSIPVVSNVEQVEAMLEQFFIYHTNFLWEPAKAYIERERDVFKASHGHGSSCSSVLVSLMTCLGQLTLADKNYLTLQFFASKVFQRKDSVKVSYENLRSELLRLEERGSSIGQLRNSGSQPNTPHHQLLSAGSPAGSGHHHHQQQQLANDQAQDVFDVEELFMNEEGRKSVSPVQFSEAELGHQQLATPTPPKSTSFISRLFRFSSARSSSSANNRSIQSMSPSTPVNDSIGSSGDDTAAPSPTLNESTLLQQELTCSLESMDRFAAHLAGQLVYYVKVRIEMIDLYDRLSSLSQPGRKFALLEELHRTLKETHTSADRNFHHPVLNRLKGMFMCEADVLLSLLAAHGSIQGWRFLDALFLLQEATNKLNLMANARDVVLAQLSGGNVSAPSGTNASGSIVSPLISSSGSVSGATSANQLRRNFTNASLSSSGSSTTGGPPPTAPAGSANLLPPPSASAISSAASPGASAFSAMSHFIFPGGGGATSVKSSHSSSSFFASGKSSSSAAAAAATATANMPLLVQWLHRFKLFLLSKYSFYFHSLLMVHLTPSSIAAAGSSSSLGSGPSSATGSVSSFSATLASATSSLGHHHGHHGHHSHSSSANYAQMEAHMRQLCARQCPPFDFHSKVVQFVRKYDATYVILVFDINHQEVFNVSGYRSPFTRKDKPTGIKTYPIVYAYPVEFPQNHMPSLIMTMGERKKELNSSDTVLIMHNRPNASVHGGSSDHHHDHHPSQQLRRRQNSSSGSPMMSVGPAQIATPFTVHNIASGGGGTSSSSSGSSIPNATYFLIRPDPLFTLVMICEKPKADTEAVGKFMNELTGLLKGSRIFAALRSGSLKLN